MTGITAITNSVLLAAASSAFTFPPTFVKDAVNYASKPAYFISIAGMSLSDWLFTVIA